MQAINRIADEFGMEWEVEVDERNVVSFTFRPQVGRDLTATDNLFLHNGIRSLKRTTIPSTDWCTRLYVAGGNKNIPQNYRNYHQRLLPAGSLNYIENASAVSAYGIIEGSKVWEDIFPTRTGTITSLINAYMFEDSGMDFDLNSYLIPGMTAKVHMQTGKLAGYEFPIKTYTNATKIFALVQTTDERGLQFPNSTNAAFQLSVGDKYKLIDIYMPASYISAAETELLNTATSWLNNNCSPTVNYEIETDDEYMIYLQSIRPDEPLYKPGDIIRLTDIYLPLDTNVRVISLRRDLLYPYKISLTLGQTQYRPLVYDITKRIASVEKALTLANINSPQRIKLTKWAQDTLTKNLST